MKQRIFNQARNIWLTQLAAAVPGIQVFFNATAKFHGALAFGLKRKLGSPFLNDTCRH